MLIALRMGAFQLLHLDRIPARAAIDESVELAKQAGHRFASGMVNAVLRKLAASREGRRGEADPDACKKGYPAWMVERWTFSTVRRRRARFAGMGKSSRKCLCD